MVSKQQLGDIDVELRSRRRFEQCAELAVIVRRSQPAPVLQHVDFRALGKRRGAFAKERRSGVRPRGNRESLEREHEPRVV